VFIHEFEQCLQSVSAGARLPFWNWIADAGAGKDAPLWQAHGRRTYFGGDGDPRSHIVENDPCADWRILIHSNQGLRYRNGLGLDRRYGLGFPTMPQPAQLQQVLTVRPYDSAPWDATSDTGHSFRNALEGFWESGTAMHNRIHGWIGGDMAAPTSPNDPIFFLHHAFVDYVWATWQKLHPLETYQPERDGPPGQNIDDPMPHLRKPVTPSQTLHTRAMGYEYPGESLSEILPSS
jgi:tyrosinase